MDEVAQRHGITKRKVWYAGMSKLAGRPRLLVYATEVRDRKARMSERHRAAVRGWSE